MNIRQIINEEVNAVLQEQEGREVIGALEQIAHGAPRVLPDLEKFVNSNITKFLQKQLASASQIKEISNDDLEQKIAGGIESGIGAASGVAKGVAKGVGKGVGKAAGIPAAKLVGHIGSYLPFGKKLGILIAASQDKSVDTGVRNAIYFALGNLLAGSMGLDLPDLGHLLQQMPEIAWEQLPFTDDDQNWDWGIVNSVDDMALLAWAYRKMKKSGVDPRDQLKRFAEFIGRTELIPKEPAGAPAGGAPEARKDMSLDAKIARANAAAAQAAQYREKGRREGMRLKKSALYQIIQEEVEVVLTNNEAVEFFDLDMSKLLDEMMDEGLPFMQDVERAQRGELPPGQASRIQGASDAMKTRAGDPSRTSQGPTAITRSPTGAEREAPEAGEEEAEELQEKEDKSFSKAAKEIEKKGTEGVFTAKADKAGMGVQAYADKVLQKDSKASTKTKRQAAFAKGAATVARENK